MKLTTISVLSIALSVFISSACALEAGTPSEGRTEDQTVSHAAQKNSRESDAFLEQNKKKPGVITLPDGLQYKVITQGKGKKPEDADIVTVHYSGKLVNGTEFDSSYKRGQPIEFPVNGVIQGWVEALKLMPVGSTWELYIPANLAYGSAGAPPAIGPDQALIFTVNLIDIKKAS